MVTSEVVILWTKFPMTKLAVPKLATAMVASLGTASFV